MNLGESAHEGDDILSLYSDVEITSGIEDLIQELSQIEDQTGKTVFGAEVQGINSVQDIINHLKNRTPTGLYFLSLHFKLKNIIGKKDKNRPHFFTLRMAQLRRNMGAEEDKGEERSKNIMAMEQLAEMARGGNSPHNSKQGVREALYSGWENKDFRTAVLELRNLPDFKTKIRGKIALLLEGVIGFIGDIEIREGLNFEVAGKGYAEAKEIIIRRLNEINDREDRLVFGLDTSISVEDLIENVQRNTRIGSNFVKRIIRGYDPFQKRIEHGHDLNGVANAMRRKIAFVLT